MDANHQEITKGLHSTTDLHLVMPIKLTFLRHLFLTYSYAQTNQPILLLYGAIFFVLICVGSLSLCFIFFN